MKVALTRLEFQLGAAMRVWCECRQGVFLKRYECIVCGISFLYALCIPFHCFLLSCSPRKTDLAPGIISIKRCSSAVAYVSLITRPSSIHIVEISPQRRGQLPLRALQQRNFARTAMSLCLQPTWSDTRPSVLGTIGDAKLAVESSARCALIERVQRDRFAIPCS